MEGEEEPRDENEEDHERKAEAWARSFEKLTGQQAQTEWYRPFQQSGRNEAAENVLEV